MNLVSDETLDGLVAGTHTAGGAGQGPQHLAPPPTMHRLYRPLSDAVDEYVQSARNRDHRILTGLQPFDDAMRGLGPKELCVVVGFSHAGKTLFATQTMLHNHERRMVLFTPDETRVLVLLKLASLVTGVSAERLEDLIALGDPHGERLVRQGADHFPHLAVYDDVSDYTKMHRGCDEAAAEFGGEPELVLFDYASLFTGAGTEDGGDTAAKIDAIKAWGKDRDVPLMLMHQSSRSAGKGGQAVTIDSGAYGGEQQAMFVVGVRRKREQYAAQVRELEAKLISAPSKADQIREQIGVAQWEYDAHQSTVTLNLPKNKRPPSRLVDDVDYTLDRDTGRLTDVHAQAQRIVRAPAMAEMAAAPVEPEFQQLSMAGAMERMRRDWDAADGAAA